MFKIFLLPGAAFLLCFNVFADDLKDLSADAVCEFQKAHGSLKYKSLNLDPKACANKDSLLKGEPVDPKQKFAFQTQMGGRSGGTQSPYIIIRLAEESDIRKIYIQNRLDNNKKWADGLTVWVSKDQNLWKRIWEAPSVEDEWTIDLPKGELGKFIMIGIDREVGKLSLSKVRIYGKSR